MIPHKPRQYFGVGQRVKSGTKVCYNILLVTGINHSLVSVGVLAPRLRLVPIFLPGLVSLFFE